MVSLFPSGLTSILPKDALWILVARESERVWLVATKFTTDTDDFLCRTYRSRFESLRDLHPDTLGSHILLLVYSDLGNKIRRPGSLNGTTHATATPPLTRSFHPSLPTPVSGTRARLTKGLQHTAPLLYHAQLNTLRRHFIPDLIARVSDLCGPKIATLTPRRNTPTLSHWTCPTSARTSTVLAIPPQISQSDTEPVKGCHFNVIFRTWSALSARRQ